MKRLQYELKGGLEEADLASIRSQILEVLEKVGVDCPHEKTLKRLGAEKGVRVEGVRIKFDPTLVNQVIEAHKKTGPSRQLPEKITVTGAWNCFNIEDMDSGAVRASTGADVREMWKLLGALKGGPVCPVYPNDIHGPLQVLFVEKTGIESTDTNGSLLDYTDARLQELAIDMYKAAGRRYRMMIEFPISPLRFNPSELEKIWEYKDRTDIDLYAASAPIPMAGSTAPMVLPGGLVQSLAESYAGVITINALSEGKIPVHPEFRLEVSDLRHMTLAYSSPESLITQLAVADACRYFTGSPRIDCNFQANAKHCDIQSAMEKTSWMLVHALAGFRNFWFGGGQLSMDEIFSPVQYVVDLEIARYVEHMVRGVPYDDSPGAAVKVISETGPGGDYMTHDTTIESMGSMFESDIFPRTSVGQWRAAGEPDVRQKAAEKARGLIRDYHHEIAPALQADLDRIWKKAESL